MKNLERACRTCYRSEGNITEDDLKEAETKVQKLTDKYITEIDKAVEAKSKEILTV